MSASVRALLVIALCASATRAHVVSIESASQLKSLVDGSSLSNAVIVRYFSSGYDRLPSFPASDLSSFHRDKKSRLISDAYDKVVKAFSSLPVQFADVDVDVVQDVLKSQALKPKELPAFRLHAGKGVRLTLKDDLGSKIEEVATNVISWVFEEVKKLSLQSVGLKYKEPELPKKEKSQNQGSGVVELGESNFDAKVISVSPDTVVLVEFFAPWCGHCKQLAPTYAQVARTVHSDPDTYGEKTMIASVDATQHQSLASKYGIQGFPTIKLFVGGKLRQDYSGPRDAASIQEFVRSNRPAQVIESSLSQVTDISAQVEGECMKAPLCVIAFLPNLYDCSAQCRKQYLSLLREEATGESGTGYGRGWQFFWLEGASSDQMIRLEEDLGVGPGVGYPNLVVVNGKREKYAPFRGSFSKAGLKDFLKGIIYGGKGASPLYPLPPLEKLLQKLKESSKDSIAEWDGNDAPPLPEDRDEL